MSFKPKYRRCPTARAALSSSSSLSPSHPPTPFSSPPCRSSSTTVLTCHARHARHVALLSTSNLALTAYANGTIAIHSLLTASLHATFRAHPDYVTCLLVLGEDLVASADWTGLFLIWRVSTRQIMYRFNGGEEARVTAMAVPSPGRLVTGTEMGCLELFEINTLGGSVQVHDLFFLRFAHRGYVTTIAAHGPQMVTASATGQAKVWSAKSGDAIATLNVYGDRLTYVALNSQVIVTVSRSVLGLCVWDARTFALRHFLQNPDCPSFNFAPRILSLLLVLTFSRNALLFTNLHSGRTVSKLIISFTPFSAFLSGERIVVCGDSGAVVFTLPRAVAALLYHCPQDCEGYDLDRSSAILGLSSGAPDQEEKCASDVILT